MHEEREKTEKNADKFNIKSRYMHNVLLLYDFKKDDDNHVKFETQM